VRLFIECRAQECCIATSSASSASSVMARVTTCSGTPDGEPPGAGTLPIQQGRHTGGGAWGHPASQGLELALPDHRRGPTSGAATRKRRAWGATVSTTSRFQHQLAQTPGSAGASPLASNCASSVACIARTQWRAGGQRWHLFGIASANALDEA
jgi:hypothetical protein